MDEEEVNYKSPIGQIIKRMTVMSKKPQIDNELGKVIDTFRKTLSDQVKYLSHGIFNTNFVEAALFLQSSAEVYGKRVDALWNEILEFHTRLIEYDYQHAKEKGGKINEDDIKRLEERRNRYKRKKNFKLLVPVVPVTDPILTMLFNEDDKNKGDDDKENEEEELPFYFEDKIYQFWKKMEHIAYKTIRRFPYIVLKQKQKTYRMKNYPIMPWEDYDLEDFEDGEINTKYSRMPNWHQIYHLFEYNDEGLFPDTPNKLVARLRLCMYKRLQFMLERDIPFNTPFRQYAKEYMAFREKFFEEEGKKWQNMPLDTYEDLGRQYEYLAKMAREEEAKNKVNERITPVPKLIHKDEVIYCSDDSSDESKSSQSIEKILLESDDDDLFELSIDYSDISKTDLFVRLEKLSSDVINNKLRQDSGFFELENENGEKEADVTNATETDPNISATESDPNTSAAESVPSTTPAEGDSSILPVEGDPSILPVEGDPNTVPAEGDSNTIPVDGTIAAESVTTAEGDSNNAPMDIQSNSGTEKPAEFTDVENPCNTTNTSQVNLENNENTNEDNFDTRSIISDHDYCYTPLPLRENKENCERNQSQPNVAHEQEMVPFSNVSQIIPKACKMKLPKERKIVDKENRAPGPPKRRKLSQKQIEKLSKSLVGPTKEKKFERFFSLNYQPQLGEGEVSIVEYESEESDIEEPEPQIDASEPCSEEPVVNNEVEDATQNDDTQSVLSEHNYFRVPGVSPDSLLFKPGLLENWDDLTIEELNQINKDLQTVEAAARAKKQQEQPATTTNKDPPNNIQLTQAEQEALDLRNRVEEWKETITPILQNLREHDFDIHEYGSRIMDVMEINETKSFASMVEGKSSAEVVRYFISSLQLANTYNIEICGVKPGELSNDTYNVKLLKRDRYHEHLTEYEAPSKEIFRKRLKRMRNRNKEQDSDSDNEPLSKVSKQGNERQLQVQIKSVKLPQTPKPTSRTNLQSNKSPQISNASANDLSETPRCVQPATVHTNTVAKNKFAQANPLKGKTIIKPPARQIFIPSQEPSTSTHFNWTTSEEDSGFASSFDTSVLSQMSSSVNKPSTSTISPSEEYFRENLIQRQQSSDLSQSTPQSSTSFRCSPSTIPRTINFE